MIQTLEVDSVILEFGNKRVLQDVYLKCETNNIIGLLGRNGAGKSCLMNIICGKLKPMNGMVRINNKALLDMARKPADILYLPQFGFIPQFLTLKRIFNDFRLDFFHSRANSLNLKSSLIQRLDCCQAVKEELLKYT